MTNSYTVTGLMSGSSMDGVDLAGCVFTRNNSNWDYEFLACETLPYPPDLRRKLESASLLPAKEIGELDLELGRYYGELINQFHSRYEISPDLLASHGHTILHEPGAGITLQAGNGKIMADLTGLTLVNDFRKEDVAQGGEGAPLAPVGDSLLFGEYEICLNLGGFSNISFEDNARRRIAFDVGPANMALNWIAGLLGREYDLDGALARSGKVNGELLEALNKLEYYRLPPPKSLGREWFLDIFLPAMRARNLDPSDRMATVAEHIAIQIAAVLNSRRSGSVLATGGGALNLYLMERLKEYCLLQIIIPDRLLIQYKEALIFALLGLLKIRGEINCLSSVTGGRTDLSTGTINYSNQ